MADKPVFGIDLGTTNSCIALWIAGKVEVLSYKIYTINSTKTQHHHVFRFLMDVFL